jgi:hypothetical protein
MKLLSAVFAFLVLALLVAAPAAQAQATRTWVSGVGDDANPCSRTAPCKTFAGAISKTAAGGEISVLDPGGFGVVTITKAITINGDGTLAGILSAGTNGIIINAGVNDNIVIRNVSINGVGTGINGIRFLAGKSLTLDNVTISGFTTRGVDMSMAATAKLVVRNTRITNGATGIFVTTTAGTAQATLEDVHLTGLTNGLEVAANGFATISNSVISGNSSNGAVASGTNAELNVVGCQVAHNGVAGLNASVSGSRIRMSLNQIYNNAASLSFAAGAVINSDGRNAVAGNTSQPAVPGGAIPLQ